jgi:hypothetical protein
VVGLCGISSCMDISALRRLWLALVAHIDLNNLHFVEYVRL